MRILGCQNYNCLACTTNSLPNLKIPTQTQISGAVTQEIMFQMKVYYHFFKMFATYRVIPQILIYLQPS